VSLDLIYGTPGESLDDWRASLELAVAQHPDHLSAYALIVEAGTKLARQIVRGEVAQPDDDLQADMYELADALLHEAGYRWYELSNWSTDAAHRSRHNLSYWTGQDWWGVGPGAHSHVGGVRWWNVKHPAAYAERINAGVSPAVGRETLDDATRRTETVLLTSRVSDGLPISELDLPGRGAIAGLISDGLIDGRAALNGRVVLTLSGRLLADAVVRRLLAG
jgi:oxygen-independent coproporphyrinogen-3 oxidase